MIPTGSTAEVQLASPTAAVGTRRRPSDFYTRMSYVCAGIAFIGFTPTYWAPVATGANPGPPVLHLHGLLFSAWTVFFVVQARFAAGGRLHTHRALGLAGIALATSMLFAGLMVAIHSIRTGIAAGHEAASREFAIVPVTIMVFFAATVGAALAYGRQPQVHKRLMLVATIAMMPPALARLLRLLLRPDAVVGGPPPSVVFSLVPNFAADLLLITAIVYDWRTRGRPHRAYLVAGACLVALQIIRVPLARSDAWYAVTEWLLRFAG